MTLTPMIQSIAESRSPGSRSSPHSSARRYRGSPPPAGRTNTSWMLFATIHVFDIASGLRCGDQTVEPPRSLSRASTETASRNDLNQIILSHTEALLPNTAGVCARRFAEDLAISHRVELLAVVYSQEIYPFFTISQVFLAANSNATLKNVYFP